MKRQRVMRDLVPVLTASLLIASSAVEAATLNKAFRFPVVMEKATVRGKVVILETRPVDQPTMQNLRVEVWSRAQDPATGTPMPEKRLYQTRTDEDGFFALPVIDEGRYMLIVGELTLHLAVLPPAPVRDDTQAQRTLVLLIPREVV